MSALITMALAAMMLLGASASTVTVTKGSAPTPASPSWPAGAHRVPSVGGLAPSSDPNGTAYDYVNGYVETSASGASVMLPQSQPRLAANAGHSLIELAVESASGQQIVEVGWIVGEDGGTLPKLFVFHWKDGNPTCYDGCGFVSLPNAIKPGAVVTRRQSQEYGIRFSDRRWWVSYENKRIGYFPASLWSGRYTKAGLIQTFGEVNATTNATCTQMGNGQFGSSRRSDEIRDFRLKGATGPTHLMFTPPTLPDGWNFARVSETAFRLGGPGIC
jgi:hypothetical protein